MGSIRSPENCSIANLRRLATDILRNCTDIEASCKLRGIQQPNISAGSNTSFWSEKTYPDLAELRSKTLGQLAEMTMLLQGPHDFLHEFTASNWDHGALYVFLQHGLLDFLAAAPDGGVSMSILSEKSGLPKDKLLRILGLLKCRHIVEEPQTGSFALTAISEELVNDPDYAQWVGFQLFETRIASAHLANALANKPNSYTEGITGFKQGFGAEMYEWHAQHPEKDERFRRAMKGVSISLDPADTLIRRWFDSYKSLPEAKIVELGGRYGFASISLAEHKPSLSFEVRCETEEFLRRGKAHVRSDCFDRISFSHVESLNAPASSDDISTVSVYLIRNLLWNWQDAAVVELLRTLLPALRGGKPGVRIVITDGVSPQSGEFPSHVEIGYRRRDVTTMTMHNVKQRNQAEWLAMFNAVDSSVKVLTMFERSSHVYKGLWELWLET